MSETESVCNEVRLPREFRSAHATLREAIEACERREIPNQTIIAALLTELMPRLAEVHGPRQACVLLKALAAEVEALAEFAEPLQ